MAKSKNIYGLPIKKGDFKTAISEHSLPSEKYAIDFIVPEGTDVFAVADGKVVYVKVDSSRGGDDPRYIKDTNWISIRHKNGELSEYAHIQYKGSLIKLGDKVRKGDLIGYSGNTGYSTEPHLHFHIANIKDRGTKEYPTYEPRFDEKIKIQRDIN